MERIGSAEQDLDIRGGDALTASASVKFATGAEDLDGESLDDRGADGSVLERGRRMLADAEAKLAGVERALARLDAGSYGLCEVCSAPISAARLAEHPSLARCVEHEQTRASAETN